MDVLACGYCGSSLQVVREGGTVTLLLNVLSKVQSGTDRTAAELALVRLKEELVIVRKKLDKSTPKKPLPPEEPENMDVGKFGAIGECFALFLPSHERVLRDSALLSKQLYFQSLELYPIELERWQKKLKDATPYIEKLKAEEARIIRQIELNKDIVNREQN